MIRVGKEVVAAAMAGDTAGIAVGLRVGVGRIVGRGAVCAGVGLTDAVGRESQVSGPARLLSRSEWVWVSEWRRQTGSASQ